MRDAFQIFHAGNGDVAIFDPATLDSVCLDAEEYKALQSLSETEFRRSLRQLGFDASDETTSLPDRVAGRMRHYGISATPHRVGGYRIVVTDKCNMRCSYCFVETNTGRPDMSVQELHEGLDFLIEQNQLQGDLLIQWFGGEPTVRFDLITEGDEYVRRKAREYGIAVVRSTIVTNGLRLTRDMIAHFLRYKYGVGVSFDGPAGLNAVARRRLNGSTVDNVVYENVDRLLQAGVHVGINLTATKENVGHIPSIVEEFFNRGIRFIYVNSPIPAHGRWQIDGADLAESLFKARVVALSKGGMLVSALDRIYQSLDSRIPHAYEHLQRDGSVIVALLPGARISLSDLNWRDARFVVPIDHLRRDPSLLALIAKDLGYADKCRTCSALAICGGPSRNDMSLRATPEPDPEMCNFFMRGLSLALFDQTGLQ